MQRDRSCSTNMCRRGRFNFRFFSPRNPSVPPRWQRLTSTKRLAGNPFFVIQFISALVEEGLPTFDYGEGQWSWDLNTIRAKGYTD